MKNELPAMTYEPRAFLNYGKQWIDQDDIDSVVKTLKSDFLTQGPKVREFEDKICEYTGAKYCVAVSNGTAALHIAVASLQIKKGKEGITSTNTFMASSNCMIYNGIKPVFADIDDKIYCIDPDKIKEKITENTRLIIPVHFAGQPCDMQQIYQIANNELRTTSHEPRATSHKLFIIEDASHAIGSKYTDGSNVGNCKYSDLTIFSFHPVKTITCGEGGAITTNNKEFYEKLVMFRQHGVTKDKAKFKDKAKDYLKNNLNLNLDFGDWYHEMQILGYNYKLSDIHSSLGISQLKKLDKFVTRRREIVKKYNKAFKNIDWLTTPYERPNVYSAFHLYVLKIDFDKIGKSRKQVIEELRAKKIGTQVHYIPVHTQPYYKKEFRYKWGDYPIAENYYKKALSIPLYPKMSNEDVNYVIKKILQLKKML